MFLWLTILLGNDCACYSCHVDVLMNHLLVAQSEGKHSIKNCCTEDNNTIKDVSIIDTTFWSLQLNNQLVLTKRYTILTLNKTSAAVPNHCGLVARLGEKGNQATQVADWLMRAARLA